VTPVVRLAILTAAVVSAPVKRSAEEKALDAQNRPALEKMAEEAGRIAEMQPKDGAAQYRAAAVYSLLAQLAIETGDKALGASAAEAGIAAGKKAVALNGANAEYRRILGTLCGQVIPANLMAALKHGKCAMEEVGKALELDPKSSNAWMSRGVGNYYLPPAFGGGLNLAIDDFTRAVRLNPANPEAHLWLGIALRKAGRNAEARQAIQRSLELNPGRRWARQQLEKTPPQ